MPTVDCFVVQVDVNACVAEMNVIIRHCAMPCDAGKALLPYM